MALKKPTIQGMKNYRKFLKVISSAPSITKALGSSVGEGAAPGLLHKASCPGGGAQGLADGTCPCRFQA